MVLNVFQEVSEFGGVLGGVLVTGISWEIEGWGDFKDPGYQLMGSKGDNCPDMTVALGSELSVPSPPASSSGGKKKTLETDKWTGEKHH